MEGREEGRMEGREEGRAEGREEGIKEGVRSQCPEDERKRALYRGYYGNYRIDIGRGSVSCNSMFG